MLQIRVKKSLGSMLMDLDLQLPFGITAVLGPSGAGKSTLLKLVAGIIRPDEGEIVLQDRVFFRKEAGAKKLFELPPYRRKIGYVSQNYSLFPHLSVRENILFGVKGKNPLFTLEEMLGWLRLTGLENRRVQQISGGQQQRVALARALMTGPSLLLLDEPFSALDALVRNKLRGDLLRIHRRFRLPIIFVTHNLEDVLAVGDYIIVLHEGKILQGGEKNLVFARPNSVQTAKLVGMKNILPARVLQVDEAGRKILVDWDGKSLEGPWLSGLEPGQRVVFGVRSEHILLIRPGRELKEQLKPNLFSARIEDVVRDWMGYRLILTFDHTRRKMEMLLPSHVYERYVDGKSTITVSFKPHSLCLLAVGSQNGGGTAPGSASTFFQGEHRIKHG